MKTRFIFSFLKWILLLFITLNVWAQQSEIKESKCISGDCKDGYGVYLFTNRDYYEGDFKGNLFSGKGKYHYKSGRLYDGEWVNGKMSGSGKTTYATGETYEGTYLNDNRHGKGIFKWVDGTSYEGDWVDDKMTGKGTFRFPLGEKYVGDVVNGKREGNGIYYNKDGSVAYTGLWKDDVRAGVATTISNSVIQKRASGDVCAVFNEICGLKSTEFASIKGDAITASTGFPYKRYRTTKQFPRSTDSYLEEYGGLNYHAILGEYDKMEDAIKELDATLAILKQCLTDRIFKVGKSGSYSFHEQIIQQKYADGFDTWGENLFVWKNNGMYKVRLDIDSKLRNNRRIYTIDTNSGSGDAGFDATLKELIGYTKDQFSAIRTTKHEETGYISKRTYTWYEVNKTISGVSNLKNSIYLTGDIYSGNDESEATGNMVRWTEKLKKALGSRFCFYKHVSENKKNIDIVFGQLSDVGKDATEVLKLTYEDSGSKTDNYKVKIVLGYMEFGGLFN